VERIRAQGHVSRMLQRIVLEGSEAEVTSAIVSPATGQVVALAYVDQQ
jgi:glycine cleavage system aminomethyltransferase T